MRLSAERERVEHETKRIDVGAMIDTLANDELFRVMCPPSLCGRPNGIDAMARWAQPMTAT